MSDTATLTTLTASMPALATSTRRATRWQKAVVPDLTAAEELLDQLEQAGYTYRRLSIVGNPFVVRCR